jgi:tetratricopeptide (TPR) repeat protein
MIFRSATIASTLFFLGWSSALGQTPSSSTVKLQERCTRPIGRVINGGDRRLPAGSLLCQGDRLQPAQSAKVEVLCYLNRKVLLLPKGNVSSQCSPLKEQEQSLQCTRHNRVRCPKRKGPTEARTTPVLIAPYSSIVLDPRPDLIWTPIPGITSYKIQVSGVGVDWFESVADSNQLTYPPHQPPLKFGNAYKITIIANQGNSPVAASLATINVVKEDQAQYIKQIVQRLINLNLSPDQAAYLDLDNLYMSYGLLTESIEVLQARVEAGSKLPEIYTTLGDRYLEAGLPRQAKPLYQKAIQLAQKIDNLTQVEKAKAGLRKIEFYSQLPTKIKLDQ